MHPIKLTIHTRNQKRNSTLLDIVLEILDESDTRHKNKISRKKGIIKNFKQGFFKLNNEIKIKSILKKIIAQIIALSSDPELINSLL